MPGALRQRDVIMRMVFLGKSWGATDLLFAAQRCNKNAKNKKKLLLPHLIQFYLQ